ncbi:MAG: HAD family phosphatase [Nitrospirae bacterium]|nr:HAD family phosphatase [Nitrospirota bacterium]
MIRAVIFDLDDVIVKTEHLKAISYARAISQLCPGKFDQKTVETAYDEFVGQTVSREDDQCSCMVSEPDVMETYREMVGRSRRDMATAMVNRFDLEPFLLSYTGQYGISEPWQALIKVRMPIYETILEDPELLRDSQWSHNVALLHVVKKNKLRAALATMSERRHVLKILAAIGLTDSFECIVTGEDVNQGKPDPEIYRLVSQQLKVPPSECLVIEDSPSGIRAGLSAGMRVIAVTTPFSRDKVHAADLLDNKWVVDEPSLLLDVFDTMIQEANI